MGLKERNVNMYVVTIWSKPQLIMLSESKDLADEVNQGIESITYLLVVDNSDTLQMLQCWNFLNF